MAESLVLLLTEVAQHPIWKPVAVVMAAVGIAVRLYTWGRKPLRQHIEEIVTSRHENDRKHLRVTLGAAPAIEVYRQRIEDFNRRLDGWFGHPAGGHSIAAYRSRSSIRSRCFCSPGW